MIRSSCTDETHAALRQDPERLRAETITLARNNDPDRSRDGWRADEVWFETVNCCHCDSSLQIPGLGWRVSWLYAVGQNRVLTLDAAADIMVANNLPPSVLKRTNYRELSPTKLQKWETPANANELAFLVSALKYRRQAQEPKPFSDSARGTALLAAMGLGALAGFLQVVSGG